MERFTEYTINSQNKPLIRTYFPYESDRYLKIETSRYGAVLKSTAEIVIYINGKEQISNDREYFKIIGFKRGFKRVTENILTIEHETIINDNLNGLFDLVADYYKGDFVEMDVNDTTIEFNLL